MTQSNFKAYSTIRGRITAGCVILAVALGAAGGSARAEDGDAKAILKQMSDYVSAQKTIELEFDSSIEVITPQLEKIQFTSSGEVLLSRPNKLHTHRVGGYSDVELVFDGKNASVFGKNLDAYAQFDGPESIDGLIDVLRVGQGVALPGADLLLTDSYGALVAGVLESKHIGRGVVDGVECEHLAFRNLDTDWQLWVQVGDQPIPRKLVITSKTVNNAPQYTVQIKDWKTGFEPAADAFSFAPPLGAEKLSLDALVGLDELPQEASEVPEK
jgi:hypothetical protein